MTWLWVIWWIAVIGSFAAFETYALRHPERQWTLSRTMAYVGREWPLSIALLGFLCGSLLTHFYWAFCPNF